MKSSETRAIAFDIGTTTIAASLIDPGTGERLAHVGALNPQREFGPDVVLRLQAACESEEKLQRMRRQVNEEMERLTRELLLRGGMSLRDLSGIAMAGNPTMEHLALGLPVRSLAFPPHRPLFSRGKAVSTARLGWEIDTKAYFFPLPGGFVGGDLVAFLYGIDWEEETRDQGPETGDRQPPSSANSRLVPRSSLLAPDTVTLFLDIGTNAEIALAVNGRVLATSAAAGPAFEGGNLSCGTAALPGAISRVGIEGDRLVLSTIGTGAPSGICGSGVIDTVSALVESGGIDSTGRLLSAREIQTNLGNRVGEIGGEPVFVIYRDSDRLIYLSQKDIREVQLAKAAIRAGMEVLFERAGISADQVERVFLTGSFGEELSAGALKSIGILDEKMVHITGFIREGALAGVEKALCSGEDFTGVDRFAEMVRVIPLSGTPAFERIFIERMNFPDK